MLTLHGSWLPALGTRAGKFAVWAETAQSPRGRRAARSIAAFRTSPTRLHHPFGATHLQLQEFFAEYFPKAGVAGPDGHGPHSEGLDPAAPDAVDAHTAYLIIQLPTARRLPVRSTEAVAVDSTGGEPSQLEGWTVQAVLLDPGAAPNLLIWLASEALPQGLVVGDDLRFWGVAARFALELLYRQRFAPALSKDGPHSLARWRPLLDEERDATRFRALATAMPPVCRALAWEVSSPPPAPERLLSDYLEAVVDAIARKAAALALGSKRRRRRQPAADEWIRALTGDPVLHVEPEALAAFERQYRAWAEPAGAAGSGAETFRVCFRLNPPPPEREPALESVGPSVRTARPDARDWSFEFLLQATDDPSLLVSAADVWRQGGSTARFLNRRLDNPQERLLAGLGRAARLFPPIEVGLRTATPVEAPLTTSDAYDLIREKALVLRASGFSVLVPGVDAQLGLRVRLGRKSGSPGSRAQSTFGWASVVEFDWQVALGGEALTPEEFEALARLKQPLVQVRGQWVELRPEQIEQALAFFRKQAAEGQLSLADALELALAPDGQHGIPIAEVKTEGWIDDLLRSLRDGARREQLTEPPGFRGQLRPYQKVGVSWLTALRRYGLGACLADDMGLGKTIQIIALLLHERARGDGQTPPALLVCPTSVVGNWRRELERFAPSLRVLVHHGAAREKEKLAEVAAQHDVVLSSYSLLHRDESELSGVEWGEVVLDEAQNIKNPSTRSAQAARRLRAAWRAALTGTPVENRLTDLWSIFHFLNPGYLGPGEEFQRRFARPIERARDATATERLQALVSPFVLRRVKTDRSIIQDLPEKNEMKVFCPLTREQATLYEAVLKEAIEQIEESEGIQRRGQVLATLTKLKQVCNHPALFLHDGSALPGRSGKLARLTEMLEEALIVGDRALIFSQYAEMGKLLQQHLETAFGGEVLFLHGGTPAAERDRLVARFQAEGRGPRLFVLSIKAGGTGLNLTQANHVFHFDRWWNPAVENQATDRAFRIGQRRDVEVHKFICGGTFEEKLDELIERKIALAQAIVGTGETWITELSNEELRNLFALRRDAIGEE